MSVRAKFYVAEITKRPVGRMGGYASPAPVGEVTLRAAGGPGNEEWASATPAGEMKMTIRTEALDWFETRLGQDIDIAFTDPAPDPVR